MAPYDQFLRLPSIKTITNASRVYIYAGIDPDAPPIIAKRLILYNVLTLISCLLYLVFFFIYISFDEDATRQASACAIFGMLLSYFSYFLLTHGNQFVGRMIFTINVIITVIAANYILGTQAASQPLLFTVGVGFVVFWQDLDKIKLIFTESVLAIFFVITVFNAPVDPMFAAEMTADNLKRLHVIHFSLSYLTCFAFMIYTLLFAEKAEVLLEEERLKSEYLLLNILPENVVRKLKIIPEKSVAETFEQVTVLFADIVGFTALTEKIGPEETVGFLEEVFRAFDNIIEKHKVEKIKTIGDAYLVVSGAPEPRKDHAHAAAMTALDMIETARKIKAPDGSILEIRVGLHSGPIVAGVISFKKFSYDIWGDTVNIASRMESHGSPSMIHVSPVTYEILKDDFIFEKRENIKIKGGRMFESSWLIGPRSNI